MTSAPICTAVLRRGRGRRDGGGGRVCHEKREGWMVCNSFEAPDFLIDPKLIVYNHYIHIYKPESWIAEFSEEEANMMVLIFLSTFVSSFALHK